MNENVSPTFCFIHLKKLKYLCHLKDTLCGAVWIMVLCGFLVGVVHLVPSSSYPQPDRCAGASHLPCTHVPEHLLLTSHVAVKFLLLSPSRGKASLNSQLCPEKTTKGFQLIKLFNYLFHIVSRLFFSQPLRDLILLNTSEMVLQTKLFTLSIYMLQFLWKVHLKLCC